MVSICETLINPHALNEGVFQKNLYFEMESSVKWDTRLLCMLFFFFMTKM